MPAKEFENEERLKLIQSAKTRRDSRAAGFTLAELMIVVAIISVLATIALPLFSDMLAKAQEATTKGNLATIRSALSIYYSDNDGIFPDFFPSQSSFTPWAPLTDHGKYLTVIPIGYRPRTPYCPGHPPVSKTANVYCAPNTGDCMANSAMIYELLSPSQPPVWMYNNSNNSALYDTTNFGMVKVCCFHKDIKGNPWTSY